MRPDASRYIVRKVGQLLVPRSLLTWMLHRDKDRSITIIDDRAAGLGLVRHSQELHNTAALRARDRHPEQAVGFGD